MRKSLFYHQKFTEDGIRRAIEHAKESIARDPTFAPAYALLAASYSTLTHVSGTEPGAFADPAREAARQAISLDENSADGVFALAFIQMTYDWDWSGAESSYRRAVALRPGFAQEHGMYGHFLATMGRFEEAIRQARRAEELDPVSPLGAEALAFVLYMARMYDGAIAEARSGLELHPETRHSRYSESSKLPRRKATFRPTAMARVYVGLGEREKALDRLERAYEVRDGDLYLLETFPVWDPLRDDPRFRELLNRLNFPD